jgi:hypothetical protein
VETTATPFFKQITGMDHLSDETPWQGALGILKTTLLVSGNLPDNFSAGSRLDFLCEHLRGPQELLKVSEMEFFWLPNSLL